MMNCSMETNSVWETFPFSVDTPPRGQPPLRSYRKLILVTALTMFAFSLLDVMMFLDPKPLELAPEMEI